MRVTHKVGKSLREAGYRVSWVGPGSDAFSGAYGIEFHCYRPLPGRMGRLLNHVLAAATATRLAKADVYYAVEPDSAVISLAVARLRQARVVFDIHEVYHDEVLRGWVSGRTRRIASRMVLAAMRWICRRADLVVAVSRTVLRFYESNHTRSMVVHNIAPATLWSAPPARILENDRGDIVVMHGWTGPDRGEAVSLAAAREACERLGRRVRVLMIEDPAEAGRNGGGVRALAKRLGAEASLAVTAPVPHVQMPGLLSECDIGLLAVPRSFGVNALPNRLFEYMAVGLPIIAPHYGIEVRSVVEATGCGVLTDCEDPKAVADALVALVSHPERAREMGAAGRVAFRERYNWEREVRPLLDWIARVS